MKYTVWLQLCIGAANNKVTKILHHFGSAKAVWAASKTSRAESGLFSKKELEKLESITLSEAVSIIELCQKESIQIICFGDKLYPFCLSVIENPPLVLYVKGKMPEFDKEPSICIVGPRKVSDFGKNAAYSLSFRLAAAGMTVLSGGALGTDTYAHAGALKASGKTVVCLGCGILSDYLKENEKLRNAATVNGCLISEYPPNVSASKITFPQRNRIMSALTLGTIVIEAPEKSGALITAKCAYEQGRDVFVIPGAPGVLQYEGSNALLRDGAKPVMDIVDVLDEYIARFPDKIDIKKAINTPIIKAKEKEVAKKEEKIIKNLPETLSKEAKIVYNQLDKQKFFPEEIKHDFEDTNQLLSALIELETEFLIKALPGGMFEKL